MAIKNVGEKKKKKKRKFRIDLFIIELTHHRVSVGQW